MGQATKKSDAQVQLDVMAELRWDTHVKETDVGVEVKGGIVTLTGTVESWTARLAAQEAAHRVVGVLDVANDIQVKLPDSHERNDADIAQAVRHALEWNVLVPHQRIRTTVAHGVVMLEGTVDFWSQYDDASRAVRHLAGVCEVKNLINVEPPWPRVSADAVRGAIEGALERHAEHAAKHVQVSVTDGTVILSGEVPSWAERNAAEGAARGTPGVWDVDNRLRVHA
jgi:osmotically-inducible protein OsmY